MLSRLPLLPGRLHNLPLELAMDSRQDEAEAVAVEGLDEPRQVGNGEIRRPHPGIVATVEAEIDGIGPVFDRRPDAVPIPRRGEEFRRWGEGGGGELAGHDGRV